MIAAGLRKRLLADSPMRTPAATDPSGKSSNRFGRGLGVVLVLIGIAILASAFAGAGRSLNTGLLGGAVVMSGLMTATDPRRNLPRRLAFAAAGVLLMGLYMLNR
ncbi:MAG TPA: hypothetical protein VF584_15935 [Longimicrobium sp.]|jgi:hypothetical protein